MEPKRSWGQQKDLCLFMYVLLLSVLNPASPAPSPSSAYKPTLLPLNINHPLVFPPPLSVFFSSFLAYYRLHCGLPLTPDWVGAVMGQNSDVTAVIFNRDELIGCNHRGAGIQVSGNKWLRFLLAWRWLSLALHLGKGSGTNWGSSQYFYLPIRLYYSSRQS